MRELIQRSHPAQNQGKATFPLPIQPPLQRLDSKTNPDIPRNRRDFQNLQNNQKAAPGRAQSILC